MDGVVQRCNKLSPALRCPCAVCDGKSQCHGVIGSLCGILSQVIRGIHQINPAPQMVENLLQYPAPDRGIYLGCGAGQQSGKGIRRCVHRKASRSFQRRQLFQLIAHSAVKTRPERCRLLVGRLQNLRSRPIFQAMEPVVVCHTVPQLPIGGDHTLVSGQLHSRPTLEKLPSVNWVGKTETVREAILLPL